MASLSNLVTLLTIQRAAKPHFLPRLLAFAIATSAVAQSVSELQVTFAYQDDKAKAVFVAGEFNHWSTSATPMRRDDSGRWTAQVRLRPGKHAYKFYVDGRWLIDPANPLETPDGFGGKNSMKIVTDAYADPVVIEKAETQASATRLMTKGDYAGLEEMAGNLRTNKTRFSDGLWKLPEFYRGLESEKFVGHDSDWAHWFDKLEAWHRAYPDSITQPVVLAATWLEYAADAHRDHEEREKRVARAREILDAAAQLPARCPHWSLVMLDVADEQDWSHDDYLQLLTEAATQEPTYYQYYSRASQFYPLLKEQGWPKFIEHFAEKFDPDEGLTVYARTAWFRSEVYGNIFKETSVEWPKMKQGFLDIEKAYPLSRWNLNAFCRFAVLAGDRETAAKLFAKLGPAW